MGQTRFTGPVVSDNGFVGDITGDITGDVTGDVTGDTTGTHSGATIVPVVAYADLGTLTASAGSIAFVSDASPAAALVFYDGSNWVDVLTGTTVTDT